MHAVTAAHLANKMRDLRFSLQRNGAEEASALFSMERNFAEKYNLRECSNEGLYNTGDRCDKCGCPTTAVTVPEKR